MRRCSVWRGRFHFEHPALRCALIDPPKQVSRSDIDQLVGELLADDVETEVALRDGQRLVARITRRTQIAPHKHGWSRQATDHSAWNLINQGVRTVRFCVLSVDEDPDLLGEVEIEVKAAGVNFRDVLLVLGAIPGDNPAETDWGKPAWW